MYIKYRLIKNKTATSWSIKTGAAKRNGKLESIHYRPGATSIFDSDNRDNPIKPEWVTFKSNGDANDPACELVVPKSNELLIEFLESLYYYGKVYERYDPDKEYAKKGEKFNDIQKALALVSDSDQVKTKAMALSIFGFQYFTATHFKCEHDLKAEAVENPQLIINAFQEEDYESRFIASLAFCHGIIKTNDTHTAVVWEDGGPIITVSPGENPITKLTEYISSGNKGAENIIQEIGVRVEKKNEFKETSSKEIEDRNKFLEQKVKQLEELLLDNQKNSGNTTLIDEEKKSTEPKEENPTTSPDNNTSEKDEEPVSELELVREEYVKVIGKIPPNMRNNIEWMKARIESAKNT